MNALCVKIKKLNKNALIPNYQTSGAAGFDFHASEGVSVEAGETRTISTGLSMEIPEGYELQVRPRSGMSLKTKIRVSNSPGTIDSDYRGEIKIIIDNTGGDVYHINVGDRIAQGVFAEVARAVFEESEELSETERKQGGFGSTGN